MKRKKLNKTKITIIILGILLLTTTFAIADNVLNKDVAVNRILYDWMSRNENKPTFEYSQVLYQNYAQVCVKMTYVRTSSIKCLYTSTRSGDIDSANKKMVQELLSEIKDPTVPTSPQKSRGNINVISE